MDTRAKIEKMTPLPDGYLVKQTGTVLALRNELGWYQMRIQTTNE
jgi:hypothetical protein